MASEPPNQLALVRSLRDQNEALAVENKALRDSGPGGPSDMEKRLVRLEGAVDTLRKDVADLRVDFARFDERSKHFPTKGFIFSVCLGLLAALGGMTALIVRFLPAAAG